MIVEVDYDTAMDSLRNAMDLCLETTSNCGLVLCSGTGDLKTALHIEAVMSAADHDEGAAAVLFSFNSSELKKPQQREAFEMLASYPGATVTKAYRNLGNTLSIVLVPVVPVL